MQPKVIAQFTKSGDVQGEIREIVEEASRLAGRPVMVDDHGLPYGLHNALYLKMHDVTVAMLNQHGRYLMNHWLSRPGWRDDTEVSTAFGGADR